MGIGLLIGIIGVILSASSLVYILAGGIFLVGCVLFVWDVVQIMSQLFERGAHGDREGARGDATAQRAQGYVSLLTLGTRNFLARYFTRTALPVIVFISPVDN